MRVNSISYAQRSKSARRCPHLAPRGDQGAGWPCPSGDHRCSLTDARLWRPALSFQAATCLTPGFAECIHFMAASSLPLESDVEPSPPDSGGATAGHAPGWLVFGALGGVAGIAIGVCAFFFLPGPTGGTGESAEPAVAASALLPSTASQALDKVELSRSDQPTRAAAHSQPVLRVATPTTTAAEPNDDEPAPAADQVPTSASAESAAAPDDAGLVAPDSDAAPAVAFASGQPADVDEYTHVVGDGETLWDIAAADGVNVEDLADRNGMSSDALVAAGDVLVIPASIPDGGG